jgi:UDP-N-acetylmuramoyl-L-alanyl-D-glutamate--2,6-diaminopimelate ligase
VIVTDDDPATENNMSIISEVIEKIDRHEWNDFFILPERKYAIKMAVNIAKPWDIVLIAWKGHERIQLTNFGKKEWNDKDELLKILEDIK